MGEQAAEERYWVSSFLGPSVTGNEGYHEQRKDAIAFSADCFAGVVGEPATSRYIRGPGTPFPQNLDSPGSSQ
jgi:hypothetical protein